MRHNENGLYAALERVLREQGRAMDCHELFDLAEIKEHAASVNRVSDYLGGLWRKGLVVRLPAASEDSRARWAYQWKGKHPVDKLNVTEGIEYAPRVIADRPSILITEEGKTMTIQLPNWVIVIKPTN